MNPKNHIQPAVEPDAAAATLTKAVVRAAGLVGVSQQGLARILGVSAATVSRMFSGQYQLARERGKEWELAVLFVRMYRSLDAIFGHTETARQWLNGDNLGLQGKPLELIQTTEGLVRVLHYLDAHRGRV
ncbi:MAG TPA: antitoxin Xre/MbcA/ParS toxin-binding domain-containing protein [Noviherbaspirillum sp.]|nr:antitoxin Xre/MbcA/ParS toxin-binding domain-containing protein [Noviherbaspirillum sp.]